MSISAMTEELEKHIEKILLQQKVNRDRYKQAVPFEHAVIENILPKKFVQRIQKEFPNTNSSVWKRRYQNVNENKLASDAFFQWGGFTQVLFIYLNSAPFLRRLERLTGIENLIPDPYFLGGGLHCLPEGGKLNVHVDFNTHPALQLDRRLNLLIYLNQDWKTEYGGNLILKNDEKEISIIPECNRAVVFSTTSSSFHGNPDPVCAPQGRTRNSLALYYYTSSRPVEEQVEHSTIFKLQENQMVSMAQQARAYERMLTMIQEIVQSKLDDRTKVSRINQLLR